MDPKISVIVPVYKTEKYLHRCVDSILAQTYTDFELLLIDDGSPDNSGAICDEYAAKDNRIRVFHKDNGGVSSARNIGIQQSKGEYTIHVDSDDWVEPHMLEELYRKAKSEDADMVICDCFVGDTYQETLMKQEPSSLNHEKVLEELFQHLEGYCVNKFVRRSCYIKYNIVFLEDLSWMEDLHFNASLLKNPIKVSYLPMAFYHYISGVNENSICVCYDNTNRIEKFNYSKKLYDKFTSLLTNTSASIYAETRFGYDIVNNAFLSGHFSSREFYENCNKCIKYVRKVNIPIWYKCFLLISCVGGYTLMYKLYTSLKKVKRMIRNSFEH